SANQYICSVCNNSQLYECHQCHISSQIDKKFNMVCCQQNILKTLKIPVEEFNHTICMCGAYVPSVISKYIVESKNIFPNVIKQYAIDFIASGLFCGTVIGQIEGKMHNDLEKKQMDEAKSRNFDENMKMIK